MDDIKREVVIDRRTKGGSLIGTAALVLALLALTLAWLAYNRAGEDIETKIRREVSNAIEASNRAIEPDSTTP